MGTSLRPLLANKCELIEDGTIKFDVRNVDETFLMIKPRDIERVHKTNCIKTLSSPLILLNKRFHKNCQFITKTLVV